MITLKLMDALVEEQSLQITTFFLSDKVHYVNTKKPSKNSGGFFQIIKRYVSWLNNHSQFLQEPVLLLEDYELANLNFLLDRLK